MAETFLFAANAVLPVALIIALGYFIKRIGLCDAPFAARLNRMSFRALLPVMLFYNLHSGGGIRREDISIVLFAAAAVVAMFIAGMIIVRLFIPEPRQKGAVLQCIFRSNFAIIGLPLAQSLVGDEGARLAAVVSVAAIPLFNIFASIALSVYLRDESGKKVSVGSIIKKIVTNPMIIGIFAAVAVLVLEDVLAGYGIDFSVADITPLYSAIQKIAAATSPVMLLALGIQFEFSAVGRLKKQIAVGAISRLVLMPGAVIGAALALFPRFGAAHYALLIALTASPVAVSSMVMATEMDNDGTLAGQLVVWTTLLSMFTVFTIVAVLKAVGIFQ